MQLLSVIWSQALQQQWANNPHTLIWEKNGVLNNDKLFITDEMQNNSRCISQVWNTK